MRFTVVIETDNAAFGEDTATLGLELQRILDHVVDDVEAGHTSGRPRDLNGNTVGSWCLQ